MISTLLVVSGARPRINSVFLACVPAESALDVGAADGGVSMASVVILPTPVRDAQYQLPNNKEPLI